MSEINWNLTEEEQALVINITDRAIKIDPTIEDRVSLMMDITACHLNGNKLRLNDLLAADEFNFMHDINGIMGHINRKNGQLMRGFLPRYSN